MTVTEAEELRQRLQIEIDGTKLIESRRALGQFATPQDLAREIACATMPFLQPGARLEMLEPAAGTGSFISAFVSDSRVTVASIAAIEYDASFFEIGKRVWSSFPVEYRNMDFTKATPDRLYDLVVANPPYVRHHGLDVDEKKRLQNLVMSETGIVISGLAGLYCHFLLLSLKWMKHGALGVWLIPMEWMSVNYGSALRGFLSQKVRLLKIHCFDSSDVRFADALVSSCVIWFRKESPDTTVEFTFGESLTSPFSSRSIPVSWLRLSEKWPPSVEPGTNVSQPCLRDFFTIRRGIATGDNTFFILTEEDAEKRRIPSAFLKPILPSPRHLETDHVFSDDRSLPLLSRRLFLFDCTGKNVDSLPPGVRDYLADGNRTTAKKRLCASRKNWFDQEQRKPAPFLCSYMGRGDGTGGPPVRFILNESDAIATNSFLMLYPKGTLLRRLREHPSDRETVWSLLQTIPAREFRRAGRCYGGGLQKMEPRELGNLNCSRLREWLEQAGEPYLREDGNGQLLFVMEKR